MVLERIERLDVGAGHPANQTCLSVLHLAPLFGLVVADGVDLVATRHVQVTVESGRVVVEGCVEELAAWQVDWFGWFGVEECGLG